MRGPEAALHISCNLQVAWGEDMKIPKGPKLYEEAEQSLLSWAYLEVMGQGHLAAETGRVSEGTRGACGFSFAV